MRPVALAPLWGEENVPRLRDRGGLSYTGTDLKPHVNFSVLTVTLGTLLHMALSHCSILESV